MVADARKYFQIWDPVSWHSLHPLIVRQLTLNHLVPYLAVTSFSLFSQLRYQRQMVAE